MTRIAIQRPGGPQMHIDVPGNQLHELTRILQLGGIRVLREDGR